MYINKLKVGDIILVSGFRPCVGTSTAAAIIAADLAYRGEKTLLITMDADIPYDAVSLLSDDVMDNHLDEMVVLENSNGLTDENIEDYVTAVTDTLFYCRGSSRIGRMTKDPVSTLNHIMDIACYQFRYVVLDMGYENVTDPKQFYARGNVVVNILSQDLKSQKQAKDYYKMDQFGADMYVVPVIADFHEALPADDGFYEKELKMDCVFAMNNDPEVYAACAKRDIANFVYKNLKMKKGGGGGLFGGRKKGDGEGTCNPTVQGYDLICEKLCKVLFHEEVV